jgi:class 3 adenylate cyclase
MPGSSRDRRLATFLFLDVVGSTSLAAELGDRRWRDLLQRFRRIVQRQVKAHGGTEQDWAGDGLFATFPDPARAVRAAVAITDAVHEIGVDVRCGVHTGEAEVVDGKLAGLGVHIAARVMSLGGAADVLVSSTVRDVMTGSSVTFDDHGTHELKGVPESRTVFRVSAADGEPVTDPLAPDEASQRALAVEPVSRRRTGALVAGGIAVVVVIVAVIVALTSSGENTVGAGPDRPITLVKLDATTGKTLATLRDDAYSEHLWQILSFADKSLWQVTSQEIVRRDPATGEIDGHIALPTNWNAAARGLAGGFGSIWAAIQVDAGVTELQRISPLSGRVDAVARFDVDLEAMDAGNDAIWMLGTDGRLLEVDPISMKTVDTYDTGATSVGALVPMAGYVWICECEIGKVVQFDPQERRIVRTIELPQHGIVFGVQGRDTHTERVWLLDPERNTLTPVDPKTGAADQPVGIGGGTITDATIVGDELWVASQSEVTKIDLTPDGREHEFDVPEGVSAGSVAPTPDGSAVWVANCGCPINE